MRERKKEDNSTSSLRKELIPLVLVGFVCNSLGRVVFQLPSFFMSILLKLKRRLLIYKK